MLGDEEVVRDVKEEEGEGSRKEQKTKERRTRWQEKGKRQGEGKVEEVKDKE